MFTGICTKKYRDAHYIYVAEHNSAYTYSIHPSTKNFQEEEKNQTKKLREVLLWD